MAEGLSFGTGLGRDARNGPVASLTCPMPYASPEPGHGYTAALFPVALLWVALLTAGWLDPESISRRKEKLPVC